MKAQEFKEIQTERLVLKPLVATFDFANELFDIIAKNREFYKYIPKLAQTPNAEAEFDFLRSAEKGWKKQTKATHGMYLRKDGTFVGVCTVFNIDWDTETGEIAAWINVKYSGQGFTTEAVKAVTQEFLNMGFKRIVIRANPDNVASCKIAENCGFEREGLLRSCEFNPCLKNREDFAIFSKVKE